MRFLKNTGIIVFFIFFALLLLAPSKTQAQQCAGQNLSCGRDPCCEGLTCNNKRCVPNPSPTNLPLPPPWTAPTPTNTPQPPPPQQNTPPTAEISLTGGGGSNSPSFSASWGDARGTRSVWFGKCNDSSCRAITSNITCPTGWTGGSPFCRQSNLSTTAHSFTLSTLSPGFYAVGVSQIVRDDLQCSGNPTCIINGGATNCGTVYKSCSENDYVVVQINSTNPSPLTTAPTNVTASCAQNNLLRINYTGDTNQATTMYSIRLYDYNSQTPTCAGIPGLYCSDVNKGQNPIQLSIDPSHTYDFWIHSRDIHGQFGRGVRINTMNCGNITSALQDTRGVVPNYLANTFTTKPRMVYSSDADRNTWTFVPSVQNKPSDVAVHQYINPEITADGSLKIRALRDFPEGGGACWVYRTNNTQNLARKAVVIAGNITTNRRGIVGIGMEPDSPGAGAYKDANNVVAWAQATQNGTSHRVVKDNILMIDQVPTVGYKFCMWGSSSSKIKAGDYAVLDKNSAFMWPNEPQLGNVRLYYTEETLNTNPAGAGSARVEVFIANARCTEADYNKVRAFNSAGQQIGVSGRMRDLINQTYNTDGQKRTCYEGKWGNNPYGAYYRFFGTKAQFAAKVGGDGILQARYDGAQDQSNFIEMIEAVTPVGGTTITAGSPIQFTMQQPNSVLETTCGQSSAASVQGQYELKYTFFGGNASQTSGTSTTALFTNANGVITVADTLQNPGTYDLYLVCKDSQERTRSNVLRYEVLPVVRNVVGRVQYSGGTGIAGVAVRLYEYTGAQGTTRTYRTEVPTNATGNFTFPSVGNGTFDVEPQPTSTYTINDPKMQTIVLAQSMGTSPVTVPTFVASAVVTPTPIPPTNTPTNTPTPNQIPVISSMRLLDGSGKVISNTNSILLKTDVTVEMQATDTEDLRGLTGQIDFIERPAGCEGAVSSTMTRGQDRQGSAVFTYTGKPSCVGIYKYRVGVTDKVNQTVFSSDQTFRVVAPTNTPTPTFTPVPPTATPIPPTATPTSIPAFYCNPTSGCEQNPQICILDPSRCSQTMNACQANCVVNTPVPPVSTNTPTLTPTFTPVPPTNTSAPLPTDTPIPPTQDQCPGFTRGNATCDAEGIVNYQDYVCWKTNYLQQIRGEDVTATGNCKQVANFNNSPDGVTLLDFAIWRVSFLTDRQ